MDIFKRSSPPPDETHSATVEVATADDWAARKGMAGEELAMVRALAGWPLGFLLAEQAFDDAAHAARSEVVR